MQCMCVFSLKPPHKEAPHARHVNSNCCYSLEPPQEDVPHAVHVNSLLLCVAKYLRVLALVDKVMFCQVYTHM